MDAMSGRGAGQLPIEVWAPNAEQVEIEWTAGPESTDRSQQVHRRRDPMTPTGDGWWRWAGPASGNGDETASAASAVIDYAFVLDGAEPALPDPRSPWQPHGVHGPSRTFDPGSFAWTDADWCGPRSGAGVLGSVVYELHVGTFTPEGTFDGAVGPARPPGRPRRRRRRADAGRRLPRRGAAGATTGSTCRRCTTPTAGRPPCSGSSTPATRAGSAVFLDVVLQPPRARAGNYLARFGPYFTDAHHTPWGAAVNLDDTGTAAGAPLPRRERAALVRATSTSTRCASTPCTSSTTTRGRTSSPSCRDAVAALSAELGRPLDLIAESDLNDTVMVDPHGRRAGAG